MTLNEFKALPVGTIVRLEYDRKGMMYRSIWVVAPDTRKGYRNLVMIYGADDVYNLGEVEPVQYYTPFDSISNYTLYDP